MYRFLEGFQIIFISKSYILPSLYLFSSTGKNIYKLKESEKLPLPAIFEMAPENTRNENGTR